MAVDDELPAETVTEAEIDAVITLQEAAKSRFFPDGTVTVRTLRSERDHGAWRRGRSESGNTHRSRRCAK